MDKKPIKTQISSTVRWTVLFYIFAVAGFLLVLNACRKTSPADASKNTGMAKGDVVTVAIIRNNPNGNGMQVMLNEKQQIFTVTNNKDLYNLQQALLAKQPIKVLMDANTGTITQTNSLSVKELQLFNNRRLYTSSLANTIDLNTVDINQVDHVQALGVPMAATGCTNMIPDLATAQLMFDYCAQQSCSLPGPYGLPYCIPFQYVVDGCYARAQQMSWIIENKFHYCTQKVFSFGYKGNDVLSVVANKWGGCCIEWWFHVTPLITVKTPTGPKAYVIDPGMFDNPVPLSSWLKAQENTACTPYAHVTSFSIQPSWAYAPNYPDITIYSEDSTFASTDTTSVYYGPLKTCP